MFLLELNLPSCKRWRDWCSKWSTVWAWSFDSAFGLWHKKKSFYLRPQMENEKCPKDRPSISLSTRQTLPWSGAPMSSPIKTSLTLGAPHLSRRNGLCRMIGGDDPRKPIQRKTKADEEVPSSYRKQSFHYDIDLLRFQNDQYRCTYVASSHRLRVATLSYSYLYIATASWKLIVSGFNLSTSCYFKSLRRLKNGAKCVRTSKKALMVR